MKCITCDYENAEDSSFCGSCGAKFGFQNENATNHINEQPRKLNIGPVQAISFGFRNYFNFKGRATRSEFWWWQLFSNLILIIPMAGFLVFIPNLSVTARRLHDLGRSGWFQLWFGLLYAVGAIVVSIVFGGLMWDELAGFGMFISVLILIALLVAPVVWWIKLMATQGETGHNKHGEDPRE